MFRRVHRMVFLVGLVTPVFGASAIAADEPLPTLRVVRSGPEHPGEVHLALDVRLADGRIFNPSTGVFDNVRLRSYVPAGEQPSPNHPFIGPSIVSRPGETIRLTLDNQLEPEEDCEPANINTPHCFNRTNLHTHGLHVSPAGNSDNIFLTVHPGVRFQYEVNIPQDHPAGTFWYHPHLHGSTALQVSSGMVGALIIRGDRLPGPARHGDIDTLLRNARGARFKERVLVVQQTQYACRDETGEIKTSEDAGGDVIAWRCEPGDVGSIDDYDQFGPSSWTESGRYTTLNGRVMPLIQEAVAGRIERWRWIHAGVRESVNVEILPLRAGAPPRPSLNSGAAESDDDWVAENCIGDPVPQWEIATDGLTRNAIDRKTLNVLQPGYRSDVLVVFPSGGDYCVVDAAAPSGLQGVENRQFLGTVRVKGEGRKSFDPESRLRSLLYAAARRWMPPSVVNHVLEDLANGLQLHLFRAHETVADDEISGDGQDVDMNIVVGPSGPQFQINGMPYDGAPENVREVLLGRAEEWTLTSGILGGHPFHIHVNPFQVVRILDPQGVDVSVEGEPGDSQYTHIKDTWRDTLFVKSGYTAIVRTRYERYIGDYVLHCHILDHEDQGMMQAVRIVMPDGSGTDSSAGGHH